MAKWAMQTTPHDEWDYDATNEVILYENNKKTYATQVNKNGFIYTWQANNGTLVAAQKVHPFVNWAISVDWKTGVPAKLPTASTHQDYNAKGICPAYMGAKGMNPAAYSPKTKLLYTPLFHQCMTYEPFESIYKIGQPWRGVTTTNFPGPDGVNGGFAAFDLFTNKLKWYNKEKYLATSGVLATGGNLVFYDAGDRWFKAVDGNDGEELWKFQISAPAIGNSITYMHKGKQYVGVMSGIGGIFNDASNFWGEPINVACSPGGFPGELERPYRDWRGSHICDFTPAWTPLRGGGALNIFSL
jgi:glucose dehydrogenase